MTDYLTMRHAITAAPLLDFEAMATELVAWRKDAKARFVNRTDFEIETRHLEIDWNDTTYRFRQQRGAGNSYRVLITVWPKNLYFTKSELPPVSPPARVVNTMRQTAHLWSEMERLRREAAVAFTKLYAHRAELDSNERLINSEMAHFERYTGVKPKRDEDSYFKATFTTTIKGVTLSGRFDHQGNVELKIAPTTAALVASIIVQLS